MTPNKTPQTFLDLGLYSWPLIAAALFEPLAGLVDTAFVGHKSTEWLAALAAAVAVLSAFTWMFNFLVHASTQSVARAMGAGEDVGEQVQISLLWALSVGLLSAVFLYVMRAPLYELVGVSDELAPYVDSYFVVRVLGHPFVLLNTTTLSLLRGLQYVKLSFWLVVICCLFNISLSWLFLWPLDYGLAGVAYATVLSFFLTWLLGFIILVRRHFEFFSSWKIHQFASNLSFGEKSLHLFGRSFVLSACFFLCTKVAASIGVIELATYQVGLQFWLFSSFVVDGVAMSATILCAQNMGAGQTANARQVVRLSLQWGIAWGVLFTLVYLLFSQTLWSFFTNDPLVLEQLHLIWPIIAVGQIFLCFSYVFDGILFGINDFSFLRRLIFYAAALSFAPFLLFAYFGSSVEGIWLGLLALGLYRMIGGLIRTKKQLEFSSFNLFKRTQA